MKFTLFCLLIFGELYLETPPAEVNSRLSNVNRFLQDKDGFLWMSSQVGLFRYDGYSLRSWHHDPNDSNSLPANWLTDMVIDQEGNLWFTTFDRGLCHFHTKSEKITRYLPEKQRNKGLGRILIGSDQQLWLGYETGGLGRFDRETLQFERFEPKQRPEDFTPTMGIGALFETRDGRIWVGNTNGRVEVFDPKTAEFQYLSIPMETNQDSLPIAWSGVERDDGSIWLATSIGLFKIIPETWEWEAVLLRSPDDEVLFVKTLHEDARGRLWVGTLNHGGFIIEPDGSMNWLDYKSGLPGSLPYKRVNTIFEDRTGIIWISTLVGGICKYDPKAPNFQLIRGSNAPQGGLSDGYVKAIHEDEAGDLWVGGNEGVDLWRHGKGVVKSFRHQPDNDNSLSDNHVRTITPGQNGQLWIGTYGGGLNSLDTIHGNVKRYRHSESENQGIKSNWIEAAHLDRQGRIWLGTNIGIERFDPATETFEPIPTDFVRTTSYRIRVRAIVEIEPDQLYLASNFGLAILNTETLKAIYFQHDPDQAQSLPNNLVRSIYRDRRDNIWIGTSGGLARFERELGTFQNYTTSDGLANNVIYCILEDDHGFLWMSTNLGLTRFDMVSEEFFNFYVEDGLQGSEFNGGASLKNSEGILYFGGINGINWFRGDELLSNPHVPNIALTKMEISGLETKIQTKLNEDGALVLEPDENFINFEFAALDFSDPDKNRYSYKLEGLDEDWSPALERNFANYTNLNSGIYTFKVRASNNEGVWNRDGISLPIIIRTPFYRTWWFIMLCLGVGAALVVDRLRMLTIRGNLLEQVVRERTSSLEDMNLKLQTSNEALQLTQSQLLQAAHEAGMTEVVNGVVHNLGNVLNSVGVTLESINNRMGQSRLSNVRRLSDLLSENQDNLAEFLTNDERGRNLIPFAQKLAELLEKESRQNQNDFRRLSSGINMLKDTIRLQQGYASGTSFMEKVQLAEIVDDMLTLKQGALEREEIRIKKTFEEVPRVLVQRHRLAHVITNLLKNAIDALRGTEPGRRAIWITIQTHGEDQVCMSITDNGVGIEPTHIDQVFQYGFTTKTQGKGFGLHSCANSMTEMGGQLTVESEGLGRGARFNLLFKADIVEQLPLRN